MTKSSLALASLPAETRAALTHLGQRLQLARKRRDLSLRELSGMARMCARTNAKIERGEPGVSMSSVIAVMLSMGMGLDIEELVRTEEHGATADEERRSLEILLSGRQFAEQPAILLQRLGARIQAKRKTRKLSVSHMANSMYATPVTVRQMEKGSPSVSLGIVAATLACLRHSDDIQKLAIPEKDRIGISLDSLKQSQRKHVHQPRMLR